MPPSVTVLCAPCGVDTRHPPPRPQRGEDGPARPWVATWIRKPACRSLGGTTGRPVPALSEARPSAPCGAALPDSVLPRVLTRLVCVARPAGGPPTPHYSVTRDQVRLSSARTRALTGSTAELCTCPGRRGKPRGAAVTTAPPTKVPWRGKGRPLRKGPYQMLVVEQVHHPGRPVAHGHEVGGRPVQTQQTQRGALLHAVHGVAERQTPAAAQPRGRDPRRPASPAGRRQAEAGAHAAHASASREGPPRGPRPGNGHWAARKSHLRGRHIEHRRGKGPCRATPATRLFPSQHSPSTGSPPPPPPMPGSAPPPPHAPTPSCPLLARAGLAPRRPISGRLAGLGSSAPWNPRAPRGWAGATTDTLGGLRWGFCSGCDITKGAEYPQCRSPLLPHPSNFATGHHERAPSASCGRPPQTAGWRWPGSRGPGSAWRGRGFWGPSLPPTSLLAF